MKHLAICGAKGAPKLVQTLVFVCRMLVTDLTLSGSKSCVPEGSVARLEETTASQVALGGPINLSRYRALLAASASAPTIRPTAS